MKTGKEYRIQWDDVRLGEEVLNLGAWRLERTKFKSYPCHLLTWIFGPVFCLNLVQFPGKLGSSHFPLRASESTKWDNDCEAPSTQYLLLLWITLRIYGLVSTTGGPLAKACALPVQLRVDTFLAQALWCQMGHGWERLGNIPGFQQLSQCKPQLNPRYHFMLTT